MLWCERAQSGQKIWGRCVLLLAGDWSRSTAHHCICHPVKNFCRRGSWSREWELMAENRQLMMMMMMMLCLHLSERLLKCRWTYMHLPARCEYNTSMSKIYIFVLEMANLGPARGPKRAGPENPGPRALRAETGLMIFYLRFLCSLCAGLLVVTRELCIVLTCKCVVYWANVHENKTV